MEKSRKNRSLLLIASLFVVSVSVFWFSASPTKDVKQASTEQQLAILLSEIHGVGQVQVYFHYEQQATEQHFLAVSQQTKLSGVIIVAEGAAQPAIKQLLKQTVGNVLQIREHRIQVVPMREKEETK